MVRKFNPRVFLIPFFVFMIFFPRGVFHCFLVFPVPFHYMYQLPLNIFHYHWVVITGAHFRWYIMTSVLLIFQFYWCSFLLVRLRWIIFYMPYNLIQIFVPLFSVLNIANYVLYIFIIKDLNSLTLRLIFQKFQSLQISLIFSYFTNDFLL